MNNPGEMKQKENERNRKILSRQGLCGDNYLKKFLI